MRLDPSSPVGQDRKLGLRFEASLSHILEATKVKHRRAAHVLDGFARQDGSHSADCDTVSRENLGLLRKPVKQRDGIEKLWQKWTDAS
jgi:hypothetical protein